jgi:hypothetical protein
MEIEACLMCVGGGVRDTPSQKTKTKKTKPDIVGRICNPSSLAAEVEFGSLRPALRMEMGSPQCTPNSPTSCETLPAFL